MLPLDLIRRDPESVRRAAALKGESAPVDEILELDGRWREHLTVAESARAEQKQLSKRFAETKDPADLESAKEVGERSKSQQALADEAKARLDELLLEVPNLFHESVPVGESESDNVVARTWGEKPAFDFEPRPHYELEGFFDFERAVKVAGSRFAGLVGQGALLERALIQFMLDVHTREHGYVELQPPVLVSSEAMLGTAQLPKFADDAFRIEGSDLWLVPTAEVPVTNWHRDEILEGARLPLRYVAHTPCFRQEAGAAGKDTRGYIRLHQFHKVELVKLVAPETSLDELESLVADAASILERLGIHYRVLLMCTGDMGFAQFKKYDLEAWAPGLGRYVEVSSCSVFNDFQARRANLRYRPAAGEPPRFVHTLNGSGLADRVLPIALENWQQADGSVRMPEVLRPYLGGLEVLGSR